MGLESSQESWQRRFTEEFCVERSTWKRFLAGFGSVPVWARAAAAVMVAASGFAIFEIGPMASPDVPRLLANAYELESTLPLRFPGAGPSTARIEKGSSGAFRSVPLIEAETQILRQIQAHPNDPRWLRFQGEAEIIQRHYTSAIQDLERARQLASGDAKLEAALDLAADHFGSAETTGVESEYAVALSMLDQVLKAKPRDKACIDFGTNGAARAGYAGLERLPRRGSVESMGFKS